MLKLCGKVWRDSGVVEKGRVRLALTFERAASRVWATTQNGWPSNAEPNGGVCDEGRLGRCLRVRQFVTFAFGNPFFVLECLGSPVRALLSRGAAKRGRHIAMSVLLLMRTQVIEEGISSEERPLWIGHTFVPPMCTFWPTSLLIMLPPFINQPQ